MHPFPTEERLTLEDSMMSMVLKMADGNPGAINAMVALSKNAARIDPDSALGAFGPILELDSHGIYGTNIWIFYENVCGSSSVNTIGLFRACQLGFMARPELATWIEAEAINPKVLAGYLKQVRERLPAFAKM